MAKGQRACYHIPHNKSNRARKYCRAIGGTKNAGVMPE